MIVKILEIENYKGIKSAKLEFDKFTVLIGKSDSTKSTILDAIKLIFSSTSYNSLKITDYYNNNLENGIKISVIIQDFPVEFYSDRQWGLYFLNEYPEVPTVKIVFEADSELESNCYLSKDGLEPKFITNAQKKKIGCRYLDTNYDKDLNFNKYSILNNYRGDNYEISHEIKKLLLGYEYDISMEELNEVCKKVSTIGKEYSIPSLSNVKFNIDKTAISYNSSIISLFVNDVLLSSRGTSDKKLLSLALNIENNDRNHLFLIDEIENGLEPYKIRFICNKLTSKSKKEDSEQIIITTHSPFCLGQVDIENVRIVRNIDGITTFTKIPAGLRCLIYEKSSEALFSKKIIAVEGKTELGYLLEMNDNIINKEDNFELNGVSITNFEGDKIVNNAISLLELGFDVLLFMDSDVIKENSLKNKFTTQGGCLVSYQTGEDIESYLFKSLSKEELYNLLFSSLDFDEFMEKVNSYFQTNNQTYSEIIDKIGLEDFINGICIKSKNIKKLFKTSMFGRALFNACNNENNTISSEINNKIIKWVKNDE